MCFLIKFKHFPNTSKTTGQYPLFVSCEQHRLARRDLKGKAIKKAGSQVEKRKQQTKKRRKRK